jgi:hypothetical protein
MTHLSNRDAAGMADRVLTLVDKAKDEGPFAYFDAISLGAKSTYGHSHTFEQGPLYFVDTLAHCIYNWTTYGRDGLNEHVLLPLRISAQC